MSAGNTLLLALADAGFALQPDARLQSVGGGDASAAWRVRTADGHLFVKTASAGRSEVLAAEAAGLRELAAPGVLRVPAVLGLFDAPGEGSQRAVLVLEWLDLGRRTRDAEQRLGTALADLHRVTAERHGWVRDNTIGRTPQHNPETSDWVEFYAEHRLRFQLELLAPGAALERRGERLIRRLPRFFDGYEPAPSLLHGDLWGGNWGVCDGEPVIFDPAVYYGDRETDLAMTRLFGGFGDDFYRAYEARWPLAPGHERRLPLYQLYHVLNHANLFGGGYVSQAGALIERLLGMH